MTFLKDGTEEDFPGGPVVKSSPSSAADSGSIPGRGTKIPHILWSNWAHEPLWRASVPEPRESAHTTTKISAAKEMQVTENNPMKQDMQVLYLHVNLL